MTLPTLNLRTEDHASSNNIINPSSNSVNRRIRVRYSIVFKLYHLDTSCNTPLTNNFNKKD